MRLTPLAKIILVILVIGASIGGYRTWKQSQSGMGTRFGGDSSSQVPPQSSAVNSEEGTELQFITSASKKGWIVEQIGKFNALPSTRQPIVLKSVETRDAMHQILDGKSQPALWSPSSVIWADRLAEAWNQKTGKTLLDTGDDNSYRLIMRTPLVFLTTKEKARFLGPLLSGSDCWSQIQRLSGGNPKKRVPWGQFKWSHADPLNANSGMLTLALILADYANRTGQGGAIESVAGSSGFVSYLKALEKDFVYNGAVEKGSSALVTSFATDPSRYDFIVAYESAALEEVAENPGLAVIYPSPTANAENAVAVLDGNWLSPQQKEGARDFLKFLAQPAAAQDGLKEHFRPLRGASLNSEISRFSGNGFRQSYSAIELPPYEALNTAAFKWRVEIAKKSAG